MLSEERIEYLVKHGGDIPTKDMSDFTEEEYIIANWGEAGVRVCEIAATIPKLNCSVSEFTKAHCVMQGGDWGAWFLTGIRAVSKELWDAIPDDMGVLAFFCICDVLRLIGVRTEEA